MFGCYAASRATSRDDVRKLAERHRDVADACQGGRYVAARTETGRNGDDAPAVVARHQEMFVRSDVKAFLNEPPPGCFGEQPGQQFNIKETRRTLDSEFR